MCLWQMSASDVNSALRLGIRRFFMWRMPLHADNQRDGCVLFGSVWLEAASGKRNGCALRHFETGRRTTIRNTWFRDYRSDSFGKLHDSANFNQGRFCARSLLNGATPVPQNSPTTSVPIWRNHWFDNVIRMFLLLAVCFWTPCPKRTRVERCSLCRIVRRFRGRSASLR